MSYKRQELLTFTERLGSPRFLCVVRVAHLLIFVLSCYVSLRSEFRVVMSVTISAYKRCSIRLYPQVFVGDLMSCLPYLCMFAYSVVLCFCFVFLRYVYPMLAVSLDCPFLIAPSVFSNIYLPNFSTLGMLNVFSR